VILRYLQKLRTFFHPERFQGWGKKRSYFEGWYFKLIDPLGSKSIAIIPGIAWDHSGEGHAFIQILDGKNKKAHYHRFPHENFIASANKFEASIGKNTFSETRLKIDLENCQGEIHFSKNVPWPKPFYSPGIMGPFAFVPFMECYHGIVSMDHTLEGELLIDRKERVVFTGGRGYIEKDWGRSFPSAYIWMQCNHFSESGISLKCSVAKIPWMGSAFIGFIAGLWWKDRLIRFTTYNRSRLIRSHADFENVNIILENPKYRLTIHVIRDHPTALASPILGLMDGRIEETMNAIIHVQLKDKKSGKILLEEKGNHAGLEVAGRIEEILV
jgi:hypothetical protein